MAVYGRTTPLEEKTDDEEEFSPLRTPSLKFFFNTSRSRRSLSTKPVERESDREHEKDISLVNWWDPDDPENPNDFDSTIYSFFCRIDCFRFEHVHCLDLWPIVRLVRRWCFFCPLGIWINTSNRSSTTRDTSSHNGYCRLHLLATSPFQSVFLLVWVYDCLLVSSCCSIW